MAVSAQPDTPKKGIPKMLIVILLIAVVAIAAVAAAAMLMGDGSSDGDDNTDQGDNSGTGDQNDTNSGTVNLANGDYMVMKTTTESSIIWMNMTMRWEVSNVDSTGYDVTVSMISDFLNYTTTTRVNLTDGLGTGVVDDNYSRGTLIGTETLSTPLGDKVVEHWRLIEEDGSKTTVTDYHVGKDTKMVYKWVTVVTDTEDPESNMTSTTVLMETNIGTIKNGDKA